jgi:transitional endoplasmic reticulum ATPase
MMKDRDYEELTTFTRDYSLVGEDDVRRREHATRGQGLDTETISDPTKRHGLEARIAVHVAHEAYINAIVSKLSLNYSILCVCDKALNIDLAEWIKDDPRLKRFNFYHVGARGEEQGGGQGVDNLVNDLYRQLTSLPVGQSKVVVLDHLDLMTTTLEGRPSKGANNIVYWLSEYKSIPVLAFADPELPLPKVIEDIFTEKKVLPPVNREDLYRLLRPEEARRISVDGLRISDQLRLYQYVSGLNVVRLRWLMRLVVDEFPVLSSATGAEAVYQRIRELTTVGELQVPTVSEDDIAGYEKTKEELNKRVIFPMKRRANAATAKELTRADHLIPKGVILHGPPRNGKTELAKWLATELNAPLIVIRGPELKNMYVGETERAIRRTFAQARKSAPSVILIDEIDALTPARDVIASGADVVAMFLTEMDGLSKDEAILVIGTTNRLDAVDPAFKAPGRFGVLVKVGYPTPDDRLAILKLYREKMELMDLKDDSLVYLRDKTEGSLDLSEENRRKQLRDALAEMYDQSFRLKAGEAFENYLDARFGIGQGSRWSCDHLRGICQAILVEAEWQEEEQGEWPNVNDRDFLNEVLESIRSASAAGAGEEVALPIENLPAGPIGWRGGK